MRILDRKYLEMDEIQEIFNISDEEKMALQEYKGSGHYKYINELLGAYIPSNAKFEDKDADKWKGSTRPFGAQAEKYYFGRNEEEVKATIRKYIHTITRIYSAMYKRGLEEYSKTGGINSIRVTRGSHNSLLESNKYGFISTTDGDERVNQSSSWTQNNINKSGKIVSHIYASGDMPHIYMENDKETNEKEELISPFVIAKRDGQTIERDREGISHEFVRLESKPLERKTKEEQQRLETYLMATAGDLEKWTVQYITNQKELENPYNRNAGILREKNYELSQKIIAWKTAFRQLAEARCADIEIDINNRIDKVINPTVRRDAPVQNRVVAEAPKERTDPRFNNDALEVGRRNGREISKIIADSIARIKNNPFYLDLISDRQKYNQFRPTQIEELKRAVDKIESFKNIEYLSKDCSDYFNKKNSAGLTAKECIARLNESFNKSSMQELEGQAKAEIEKKLLGKVLEIRCEQELKQKENSDAREFLNMIRKNGLDNSKANGFEILAELLVAEKGPLDQKDAKQLETIKTYFKEYFNDKVYEISKEKITLYNSNTRASSFAQRYKNVISKNESKPENRLVKYLSDVGNTIESINNHSMKEYVRLTNQRENVERSGQYENSSR